MWSPKVNHHYIHQVKAYDILNDSDKTKDIDQAFCVFPYTVAENSENSIDTTALKSTFTMPHPEDKARWLMKTNPGYCCKAISLDKFITNLKLIKTEGVLEDFQKYSLEKLHKKFFDHFKYQKLVDLESCNAFIKKFDLTDDNNMTISVEKEGTVHHMIKIISKNFQLKYNTFFGFIEGQHRAFSILCHCYNLKMNTETRLLDLEETNDTEKKLLIHSLTQLPI